MNNFEALIFFKIEIFRDDKISKNRILTNLMVQILPKLNFLLPTFKFKQYWSKFCAISRNFSQIKNARIFMTRSRVTLPGFLIPSVREGNSSRFAWESCSEGWVSDFQILRNSFWWKMAFLVHFCPFVAARMRETLELIVP